MLESKRSKISSKGNNKEVFLVCWVNCIVGLDCKENNDIESMLNIYNVVGMFN